jgi:formyltetrahydrofolate-dependent phosphoribosylglycinamide formyltransferase
VRLGVLISGGGRTMVNFAEKIAAGELNADIRVVIASRDCSGVEKARELGLAVEVISRKAFDSTAEFSDAITECLVRHGVELVTLAGFLSMYEIPERYAGRVMNIHPALLPKFGGQGMFGHHVHEAVLAAGEAESGCTVHFATNEYDAGPIILQRKVPVKPDDTPDTLADRVFEQELIAFPEAINLFAAGQLVIEDGEVRVDS